jgi:hypothetical protein
MRRKSKYNLDAKWDDPFEHKDERRTKERCPERIKIKIGVRVDGQSSLLVGAAIVSNISQGGMLCKTKHQLHEGQEVFLSIPTKEYSKSKDFPLKFIGAAKVSRIDGVEEGVMEVGLNFGADLSEDMSFSLFIEALQSIAEFKASL